MQSFLLLVQKIVTKLIPKNGGGLPDTTQESSGHLECFEKLRNFGIETINGTGETHNGGDKFGVDH